MLASISKVAQIIELSYEFWALRGLCTCPGQFLKVDSTCGSISKSGQYLWVTLYIKVFVLLLTIVLKNWSI
jgi:hypothetical protein